MNKKIEKTSPSEEVHTEIIAQNDNPSNQIDTWIKMRKDFSQKVVSIMVEGKDFHKLNFRGKDVQVLAKGGAEKVASALGWTAEFIKDTESFEMLGSPVGTLCYICNLHNGKFVGQGRGARNIKQDSGDINKSIKMAQKSAFIDAILRASGLSDLFTQDLEREEESTPISQNNAPSVKMATDKQMDLIKDLVMRKRIKIIDLVPIFNWYKPGMKDLSISQAKELIDWLFTYIPSQPKQSHIDKDRNVVEGELPTIQAEIDLNDKANEKLAAEIGF